MFVNLSASLINCGGKSVVQHLLILHCGLFKHYYCFHFLCLLLLFYLFFYLFGVFIKEVNVLWEVRKCNYLQKTNIIHQHVHPYRNVVGSNHYKMLNLLVFITCWTVAKLCLIYQEKLLRKSSLLIVLTYNLLVHCKWKLDVVAVFTHIFTHFHTFWDAFQLSKCPTKKGYRKHIAAIPHRYLFQ